MRQKTKQQYGNMATLKGAVMGEIAAWCRAGPSVDVRGVTTSEEKKPYAVLALHDTILMYFQEHLK